MIEPQTEDKLAALFIAVRVIGVIILMLGLWAGMKIFFEAWNLYNEPQSILKFADAVEEGSHLNQFMEGFHRDILSQINKEREIPEKEKAKPSYFAAWTIVVILLLVAGRIAIWAITAGGQLALYNGDSQKIATAMVKETIRQLKNDDYQ